MWVNFSFKTNGMAAGVKGSGEGVVNPCSGKIIARISYGIATSYRDNFNLTTADEVNLFPYTDEDHILLAAKKAIKKNQEGA